MRFLKNKVARALEIHGRFINELLSRDKRILKHKVTANRIRTQTIKGSSSPKITKNQNTKLVQEMELRSQPKSQKNSAKNIVKNFGRAIASFCLSEIALLYLEPLMMRKSVVNESFKKFIYNAKDKIDSISTFRSLLLSEEVDSDEISAFKRIFQEMSIIFIKYFSVNWIFSSRLLNKIAHLNCRFKMLRRIMNPQYFTYLKNSA